MSDPRAELAYLAHLFDGVYRPSVLGAEGPTDWARFERLVRLNKIELFAYGTLLDDGGPKLGEPYRTRFQEALDIQRQRSQLLGRTLRKVRALLGGMPFVIVKTYRPFPYFTHDVDVVVLDVEAAGEAVTRAGLEWEAIPADSVQVKWAEGLEIEIYGNVLSGAIHAVDDEFAFLHSREQVLDGVSLPIAGPEGEIMSLIADGAFRLYELKLGDMVYIYTLAGEADWDVLLQQASKHGWREEFEHMARVLNGYHHVLYAAPSPIERHVPGVADVPASAPYVTPVWIAARTLRRRGLRHLLKLPAYASVPLKQRYPALHRAYVRWFLQPVGRFILRYLYR